MAPLDDRIPEAVREIFDSLRSDVVWLHGRWVIYRQLYGQKSERVDLLNESAGTFFNLLQQILLNDTVLGLSQLTDLPESFGHENLVFEQLLKKLDHCTYPDLAKKLRTHLDETNVLCEPFRNIRNRRVAHTDLKLALKVDEDPLPGISREMVERALKSIRQFMNDFESYFCNSTMLYEHCVMDADGESLIWQLKRAADYRDGIKDGTISRNRILESRFYKA